MASIKLMYISLPDVYFRCYCQDIGRKEGINAESDVVGGPQVEGVMRYSRNVSRARAYDMRTSQSRRSTFVKSSGFYNF